MVVLAPAPGLAPGFAPLTPLTPEVRGQTLGSGSDLVVQRRLNVVTPIIDFGQNICSLGFGLLSRYSFQLLSEWTYLQYYYL